MQRNTAEDRHQKQQHNNSNNQTAKSSTARQMFPTSSPNYPSVASVSL